MKIDRGYSLPTPELNWPSEKKDNNLLKSGMKEKTITNLTKTRVIIRGYYEELYVNKYLDCRWNGKIPRKTQITELT